MSSGPKPVAANLDREKIRRVVLPRDVGGGGQATPERCGSCMCACAITMQIRDHEELEMNMNKFCRYIQ